MIHYEVQGLNIKRDQTKMTWSTFESFSNFRTAKEDCKRKKEYHPQFKWRVIKVRTLRSIEGVY
jgi:hypothetical protein